MGYKFFHLLIFWNILIFVECEPYYSVVAPGTIRPNSLYSVTVNVHDTDKPSTIKLSLEESQNKTFAESKTIEVETNSLKQVTFEVPDIHNGKYNLIAEGTSGIIFKNITELNFDYRSHTILIQTDKAIYKPGDLVLFRIIYLDSQGKPPNNYDYKKIRVEIKDPQGNIVRPYKNIFLDTGVYENNFQLSSIAPLGYWKIVVDGETETQEQSLEVAEYVLPKFEVTIEPTGVVVHPILKFAVTVKAKYTYGKYVTGKANITLVNQYYNQEIESKVIPLKGKAFVEFDYTYGALPKFDQRYSSFRIKAEITEKLTGLTNAGSIDIPIHEKKHVIKSVDIPKYLTVDSPFSMEFQVTDQKGLPIQGTCDSAQLLIALDQPNSKIVTYLGEQNLNKNGAVNFKIKQLENLDKVYLPNVTDAVAVVSYKYADDLRINLNLKQDMKIFSEKERREKIGKLFLSILNEKLNLHEDVNVEVESEENLSNLVYQIVASGDIITSGKIEGANTKKINFKFIPNQAMVPRASIFVYFISEGSIHFAEKEIHFEEHFKNFLKVKLPNESQAGKTIDITVSTEPGSYVGLLGVDQSVLLKKSGNDLEENKVVNEMGKFSTLTNFPENLVILRNRKNQELELSYGKNGVPVVSHLSHQYIGNLFGVGDVEDFHITYKIRDVSKPYPGEASGLVTLTNAHFPYWKIEKLNYSAVQPPPPRPHYADYDKDVVYLSGHPHRPYALSATSYQYSRIQPNIIPSAGNPVYVDVIPIRKDFPETWLWQSFSNISSGELTFNKIVPDTITSWVVTGFSVNPENGLSLGVMKKMKVFQPFFITMNLPYSVINGEIIAVPVSVSNYLNEDLRGEVHLQNDDNEFEFVDLKSAVEKVSSDLTLQTKAIFVPADAMETVYFIIRPKKAGKIILKATATTTIAGDSVHHPLLVKPEGVTKYENKAALITKDAPGIFYVDIPKDVVPDSVHVHASIVGDLLGSTLKNLHNLVRTPSGCGEQNMVKFVPNYLVLKYLKIKKQRNKNIEETAIQNLRTGYQSELRYRNYDGSFSNFRSYYQQGSTWLTAYVARSFKHAADFIDVDQNVIEKALDYLTQKQTDRGNFIESGTIFNRKYASGTDGEVILTSFTLLAFLDNTQFYEKYNKTISQAVNFIQTHLHNKNNLALALGTYALQTAKHKHGDIGLSALLRVGNKKSEDKLWWNAGKQYSSAELMATFSDKFSDIETTSYALLAILESGKSENVYPIIKWLIEQQDSTGSFGSTQSTVLALQALIKYSEKFNTPYEKIIANIAADGKEVGVATIYPESGKYLLSYEISPNVQDVSISITEGGSTIVAQVSYQYNVIEPNVTAFEVNTRYLDGSNSEVFTLSVCSKFIPKNEFDETNMVVMEVGIPSGYQINKEQLDPLNAEYRDVLKQIDTADDNTKVIFYFDRVTSNDVCPKLTANRYHKVAKQKPAPIVIYDYYRDDWKTTTFYKPQASTLCDICEDEKCAFCAEANA